MKCAKCENRKCYEGKDCSGFSEEMRERILGDPEALKILEVAAAIEADHYMQMTRVEETLEFARNLGVRRIGVAFCLGLPKEAATFCELAEQAGFEVSSVCCKVCGIDKADLGLKKLWGREVEATCTPMAQAEVLNRDGTGLNVAIGLCVGHDSLFLKHSDAPTTVLIAKDRVLAHNPVGALYSNYYRRKFAKEMDSVLNRKE